jgi:hypothetical protein
MVLVAIWDEHTAIGNHAGFNIEESKNEAPLISAEFRRY